VFRIAINDRWILKVKDGKVRFSWKDYRTGRFRQMKLLVDEFIHGVPLSHAVNKPEKQGAALNPLLLPSCAARVKPNLN